MLVSHYNTYIAIHHQNQKEEDGFGRAVRGSTIYCMLSSLTATFRNMPSILPARVDFHNGVTSSYVAVILALDNSPGVLFRQRNILTVGALTSQRKVARGQGSQNVRNVPVT